jgi:tRNA modification GTPase
MSTIVAIASAVGPAGVAVIRVSGPLSFTIAQQMGGITPQPRYAHLAQFKDQAGDLIDQGLMIWFQGPQSFTGEDVLELHTHGGEVIPRQILFTCIALGAQLAEPGEFTRRAYAHGKLDLVQAEAVGDLISAQSTAAARGAMRSLNGVFSDKVKKIQEGLTGIRLQIEGGIDFPEENLETESLSYVRTQLSSVSQEIDFLLQDAERFRPLRAGCRVVLIGAPNVGKSSLLNALAREDLAIVSPLAGTTRDTVRSHIEIQGIRFEIVDTAGIRNSEELVEKLGIERSKTIAQTADLVLRLTAPDVDNSEEDQPWMESLNVIPCLEVKTKADLIKASQRDPENLWVSAQTGEGLENLERAILKHLGWGAHVEPGFLPRDRHISSLRVAQKHMQLALSAQQEELFAEDLRLSQRALDLILGEFVSDDLLGEIFSRFCIGK